MLNLLRQIRFPKGVATQGHVIPAELLGYVSTHEEIIDHANQRARDIIEQAQAQANQIRQRARLETAQSLQHDLSRLRSLAHEHHQELSKAAASICIDICETALEQFINTLPDAEKIATVVHALVHKRLGLQELCIQCHPAQLALVEASLAEVLSDQLMFRHWEVQADEAIKPYELKIKSVKGSEIRVSLDNLLALYKQELRATEPEIQELLDERNSHAG